MATHSSVLAWRIPGMAEPGGLPSMGLHRVGHDWSGLAAAAASSNFTACALMWVYFHPLFQAFHRFCHSTYLPFSSWNFNFLALFLPSIFSVFCFWNLHLDTTCIGSLASFPFPYYFFLLFLFLLILSKDSLSFIFHSYCKLFISEIMF